MKKPLDGVVDRAAPRKIPGRDASRFRDCLMAPPHGVLQTIVGRRRIEQCFYKRDPIAAAKLDPFVLTDDTPCGVQSAADDEVGQRAALDRRSFLEKRFGVRTQTSFQTVRLLRCFFYCGPGHKSYSSLGIAFALHSKRLPLAYGKYPYNSTQVIYRPSLDNSLILYDQ